jgi:hypothetical protein
MKISLFAVCTIFLSTFAFGQDIYSAHSDVMVGCYKRVYSQVHLSKNPRQKVKEIQLSVFKIDGDLNLDLAAKDKAGVVYYSDSDSADILSARPEGVYLPSNDVMVDTMYDSGSFFVNFGKRVTVSITKNTTLSLYTQGEGDAVVGDKTLTLEGGKTNGVYLLDKVSAKPCL